MKFGIKVKKIIKSGGIYKGEPPKHSWSISKLCSIVKIVWGQSDKGYRINMRLICQFLVIANRFFSLPVSKISFMFTPYLLETNCWSVQSAWATLAFYAEQSGGYYWCFFFSSFFFFFASLGYFSLKKIIFESLTYNSLKIWNLFHLFIIWH